MNIYEKLSNIQAELKAPKGQFNKFGNYRYRSCEDILEAVKPICKKHNTVLVISDELKNIGDRYYIEATAKLIDVENENQSASNTAYAREEESKKGMDASQITGTASSYARKYALNGLFNIDDTKDADTNEYKEQIENQEVVESTIDKTKIEALNKAFTNKGLTQEQVIKGLAYYGYSKTEEIKEKDYMKIYNAICA